jgi:hypothetical protein
MKREMYKKAWCYFKTHKFTPDDARNLRLGAIVSMYGISFAVEKFLLMIGSPLPDSWWFLIYGFFAVLATYWWFEDAVFDLWEKYTTEDDELYARQQSDKVK